MYVRWIWYTRSTTWQILTEPIRYIVRLYNSRGNALISTHTQPLLLCNSFFYLLHIFFFFARICPCFCGFFTFWTAHTLLIRFTSIHPYCPCLCCLCLIIRARVDSIYRGPNSRWIDLSLSPRGLNFHLFIYLRSISFVYFTSILYIFWILKNFKTKFCKIFTNW